MKKFVLLIGLTLSSALVAGVGSGHWEYEGKFRLVKEVPEACEFVFSQLEYESKFFLVGATGRTAVIHLTDYEGEGFFHGVSLVGLWGYGNEVRVEKTMHYQSFKVDVVAQGLINPRMMFIEYKATVIDPKQEKPICEAIAEYTGMEK